MSALTTLTIRQAMPEEFEVVFELLAETIQWLRSKGLDQWSTWETWRTKMQPSLARGDVWLLCDGESLIGTITVEMSGDPDFWTPAELAESSGYVSKLAVRRNRSGEELGRLLLDWASDHAYRHGCKWLRLDAWKTNERLHAYYNERGWKYVRTVEKEHRRSGTLFQIIAAPLPVKQRSRLKEVPPIPSIDAPLIYPAQSPDPAGNWQPGHYHWTSDLVVERRWLSARPMTFIPGYRYRIRHGLLDTSSPGEDWTASGHIVESAWQLDASTQLVLSHDDDEPCCIRVVRTAADSSASSGPALG